jgi:hypothetical protein
MVTGAADSFAAAAGEDSGRTIRVGEEDEEYDVETAVVLVRAFHHGTDRRSQICNICTTPGMEPPDWSASGRGLAVDRMRSV